MKKTAVIIFNLGGPDKLSSVQGFLFNLFNDKAIIGLKQPFRFLLASLISSLRNKKAQNIYNQIGGGSPILKTTIAQGEALEKELSFSGNFKVFVSMRYWHPMSKQVAREVKSYNPDEIIFLPLYPQFSTTTTDSSFKDFKKSLKKQKVFAPIKAVCCYPNDPLFINAHARLIKNFIEKAIKGGHKNYRLLFSAHGLPKKIIESGDPYVFQVETSAKEIINNLQGQGIDANPDYAVCYQSKVGPLQWVGPSLDFEIKRAALDKKSVIIIPIAFVSDHLETLAELDIEYQEMAKIEGIKGYYRVPSFNVDGYFIKSLVEICKKTANSTIKCNGHIGGERICPKSFNKCPNQC